MTQHWIQESRKRSYDGYRKVDTVTYTLPDDSKWDFDIQIESDAVAVLALTSDARVILATQYRPGPDMIIHELPGGGVERGEDITEAAARELLEETGFKGDLEYVITCNISAYSTQKRNYFVARNCKKVSEQKLDQSEFVEVTLMELDAFLSYVKEGRLTDTGGAYTGLHHLNLLSK